MTLAQKRGTGMDKLCRTLGSRNLPVNMHKHKVNNSIQETDRQTCVGEHVGEGRHDKDRREENWASVYSLGDLLFNMSGQYLKENCSQQWSHPAERRLT